MPLNDYIAQRMAELGISYGDILDAGVSTTTMQRIRNCETVNIKDVTKQKLALVLKCSVGDINAALADTPSPLKDERTRTVPVKPEALEEEPQAVDEQILQPLPLPKVQFLSSDRPYIQPLVPTEDDYKAKLKHKVLQMITEGNYATVNGLCQEFGREVMKELLE